MKVILSLAIIFCFIKITCSNKFNGIEDAQNVVKNKCFMCHAPQVRLEGMPLDSMFNTYGKKRLKKYLRDEIDLSKTNHHKISLSSNERKLIMLYLEKYKNGVYH